MQEWGFWRPIMEGMSTFSEMSTLYADEIEEFNIAIDLYIDHMNK